MKNKPKEGMKLHTQIALGKKPKDFKGAIKGAVVNKKK
jgi:hypothetical protein